MRRYCLWTLVLVAGCSCSADKTPEPATPAAHTEATSEQVHQFCGACHAYPPPDSLPREVWKKEVKRGFEFYKHSDLTLEEPSLEGVIQYYERRAPERLPLLPLAGGAAPVPVRFDRMDLKIADGAPYHTISNVNLVHLFHKDRLDLLVCEMREGKVLTYQPYEKAPAWRVVGEVPYPAHAEVADLDQDGIQDILVANLGWFTPTDGKYGTVVWLKGTKEGTFRPYTILGGVGRVADVQAGDFRGTGKLDLVVAVFGWRNTGEILFLENQTTDWSRPKFVPRVVDARHGAIHVPVADLNGDGKPDFVGLISQEHETVVAYLNEGGGKFSPKTIYDAPHPAFGSSGIQLVDLNKDRRLDVLYTNGDTLDSQDPSDMMRPYNGIHWLENKGTFPFKAHLLAPLYGVHCAVAADFRGRGVLDIAAVGYLSIQPGQQAVDSILYLEQKSPGKFVPYTLEKDRSDHVTCVAGDVFGRGQIDLVTANFTDKRNKKFDHGVTIWKNLGAR